MTYTKLGTADLTVSRVCFGTLWIGGVEEQDALGALERGYELGITFIDTAEGYGQGSAEKTVGKFLRGKRDGVMVATKCGLDWGQFEGQAPRGTEHHVNMVGARSDTMFRNSHPDYVRLAIDASLQRLATDYIDLYQIHYPDSTIPFADTIGALQQARDAGKVRYFGVSNFSVEQLRDWRAAGPLHSLQPMYNMLSRDIEAEILPYCRSNGIGVLAYSTIAHGLLTGKFTKDTTFPDGDMRPATRFFKGDAFVRNLAIVARLREIADAKQISLGQLAIAWVLAQPGLTSALVAAKSPSQVEENAVAGEVELAPDELAQIARIVESSGGSRA